MTNQTGTTNSRQRSTAGAFFATKYTKSSDTSGWLKVINVSTEKFIYLCEFTEVLIQRESGGYTFFMINDGHFKNTVAKMSSGNAAKYLVQLQRGTGAKLNVVTIGRKKEMSPFKREEYNQFFSTLTFNGKSIRITIDSDVNYKESNRNSPYFGQIRKSQPLPYGTYKIMIPDFAKDASMTAFYRTNSGGFKSLRNDTVWFPIEYAPTHNSNFVHVGNLSEGCITCYEIEKWNDLYDYLIKNRTKDGYIGELTIIDGSKVKKVEQDIWDKTKQAVSDAWDNVFG